MVTLSAPLHRVFLACGLVEGDAVIAILIPDLPIEGVDVILGNDLAGDRVWASGCPVKVSTQKQQDDCERNFPEVFTAVLSPGPFKVDFYLSKSLDKCSDQLSAGVGH